MHRQNMLHRVLVWACLIFVPLAFGIYSVMLGQDTNWDLLNYHLYNPYAFLNNRIDVDLAPAGLQTYFNPFLDVVYYLAINNFSAKTIGFLLGSIQGLSFIFVYKISNYILKVRQRGHYLSLFLAFSGVFSVGFLSELGTTLNDSLIGIFPLISLLIILSKIDAIVDGRRHVESFLFCSGLVIGVGCGLKLVVAIYALSLCSAFLLLPVAWSKRFKFSFIFGVAVLVGLAFSGGYWFYKTWSHFGNPIFPQLNDIFIGELAKPEAIRDIRFLPKSVFEKIFYPFIFTANPLRVAELRYEQISWIFAYVGFLVLLVANLFRITKTNSNVKMTPEAIFFLSFFGFTYFLWLNIFGIYRYLIPIEILIPLLLYIVVSSFVKTEKVGWVTAVFIVCLTAVNVRGTPNWGRTTWADTVYRVEPGMLSISPEPAAVYLVGQPLAWIVPALQIEAPFIQLAPNFPVSEVYWQRAKFLVSGREGRSIVVLESNDPSLKQRADAGLSVLGLMMDMDQCGQMAVRLGATKHEYNFCEIRKVDKSHE